MILSKFQTIQNMQNILPIGLIYLTPRVSQREIPKYVSECDICQRVKASHLKTTGVLRPLTIPSWKWEDISMDFIIGLPNTSQKHDSIWIIVDRLTKTAHFHPVHTTYNAKKYAEIYLDQIVRLHGVPKTIISDHGA
jgi:hypothetical protein